MRRRYVVGALIGLGAAAALHRFAPRMPDVMYAETDSDAVVRMLKLAEVTNNDIIYDLGCGDGRFALSSRRRGSLAHAVWASILMPP